MAVWIALRIAVAAFVLSMLTGVLMVVWFIAGGFACVYLYRRRTGERLSQRNGAHLGWLAGVFAFVFGTLLFTLVEVQLSDAAAAAQAMDQIRKTLSESDAKMVMEFLRAPAGMAMMLILMFTIFTLLPAFGGWLGARFLQGNRSSTDQRNA